ncbi:serine threonine-protein phosphatase 6 regulatory ankyrin repeat subunit b protein [Apiospora rasikravindrae]|uniref:Serine threonine-protein phosphatase 6 regulatory ankyrin repeat subunit b protein n=1 Tax=Apiospora rasikravindrae TaxID=990691 RepID=A0ABR1TDW6_9PEZI
MDSAAFVDLKRPTAKIEQLPNELLVPIIVEGCEDHRSMARLAAVSRRIYSVASDVLYGSVIRNREWRRLLFWAAAHGGLATLQKLASFSPDFLRYHSSGGENDNTNAKQKQKKPLSEINFGIWKVPQRPTRIPVAHLKYFSGYFTPLEEDERRIKYRDRLTTGDKCARLAVYYTPVHVAAAMGDTEVLEFLLSHLPRRAIDKLASLQEAPLENYREPDYDHTQKAIKDLCSDIQAATLATPLYVAVLHGRAEAASLLLRRGASPYRTPLQPAAVLRVLVEEARIPVDCRDVFGETSLFRAALVELGASVNGACFATDGVDAWENYPFGDEESLLSGLIHDSLHCNLRPWRAAARLIRLGAEIDVEIDGSSVVDKFKQKRRETQAGFSDWSEELNRDIPDLLRAFRERDDLIKNTTDFIR